MLPLTFHLLYIHNVDTQPLQTKSLDTLEHCMYVEELTTYVHKK